MNIVMPMAGRGHRFVQVGVATPKPLINVRGRPMYSWAMDGLPLERAERVIFVCLREHLESLRLESDIRERYSRYRPVIIPLDSVSEGQACTVLAATEWIDNQQPLLIFNADTYCPTNICSAIDRFGSSTSGILDVFPGAGEKWSFARLGADDRVLETAEKRRISDWASTGLYYFGAGGDFVRHAQAMIQDDERSGGEFYVAPIYNRLIEAGLDIRANKLDRVWVLGTPEDLARFDREYP